MGRGGDAPELVQVIHDRATGLRAVIALHDTRRGPARGGTRLRRYASIEAAQAEATRLARAMHNKFGVHGLSWTGGKGVIVLDDEAEADRGVLEARLRAYGAAVERIKDRFGTGPDLGIGEAELLQIRATTEAVSGVHAHGRAGDATAAGVLEAMRAGLEAAGRTLAGARVSVLGLGAVGGALARRLRAAGATLLLADIDAARAADLAAELEAEVIPVAAAGAAEVDVFAPCATGDVLGPEEISSLRCRVVCGAANDQLQQPEADLALALRQRGILAVPDFVANGGAAVLLTQAGEEATDDDVAAAARHVAATARRVLEEAERSGETPWSAGLALADRWWSSSIPAPR